MLEADMEARELEECISLFFDERTVIWEIKETSHGEKDFREAIFIRTESGNKFVIKLADNDFTFAEKIKMWQRCAEEYRSLGYYTPAILKSKSGDFPIVQYKGHKCIAYAEEFSKYSCADDAGNGIASSKFKNEILTMTAKIANLYSD